MVMGVANDPKTWVFAPSDTLPPTEIPPPLGKLLMMLLLIVAPFKLDTELGLSFMRNVMAVKVDVVVLVVLVKVLPVTVALLIVPPYVVTSKPPPYGLVQVLLVSVSVPSRLLKGKNSPADTCVRLNAQHDNSGDEAAVPTLLTRPLVNVKLVTSVPLTPLSAIF